MAGLDEDEDLLVEDCLSAKPYPITLHDWRSLSEQPRPVFINLLFNPEAVTDRVLATAAPDLAYTLFAILGVTGEE